MRIVTCIRCTMAFAAVVTVPPGGRLPGKERSVSIGKHNGAMAKEGVKTPGVQIPFASLKPEAQFAVAPDWLAFAGQVWIPDVKDGLSSIDAKTSKLGNPIAGLGKPCGGVVSAFGSLWIPDCGDGKVDRVDLNTHKLARQLQLGVAPGEPVIAATADSIWLLADGKTTLLRIDPDQNQVVSELRLPAGCAALAFGENALWIACPPENLVLRVDPRTNLVDQRIAVAAEPRTLAVGNGAVWVLCKKEGKLERIDPKTNEVAKSIDLGVSAKDGGVAAGLGSVWVTFPGFPITRVDPETNLVVQQFYGNAGGAILTGDGSVWLSNPQLGNLWRLDPERIAATVAE